MDALGEMQGGTARNTNSRGKQGPDYHIWLPPLRCKPNPAQFCDLLHHHRPTEKSLFINWLSLPPAEKALPKKRNHPKFSNVVGKQFGSLPQNFGLISKISKLTVLEIDPFIDNVNSQMGLQLALVLGIRHRAVAGLFRSHPRV